MDLECNIAADMATNDEATSFQQRLDGHRGWLRRLVQSRISDPNTADDVLQEVDTAAIASSNLPNDASQLGPWLCRIALRQCALVIRKSVRRQRLEERLHENGDGRRAEPVDPIYWLIAEEERTQVGEAMAQIDDESRQVLTWKYVDRLKYAEIAERLGLTRHAAEYRVVRARQSLRAALLALGFEGENKS